MFNRGKKKSAALALAGFLACYSYLLLGEHHASEMVASLERFYWIPFPVAVTISVTLWVTVLNMFKPLKDASDGFPDAEMKNVHFVGERLTALQTEIASNGVFVVILFFFYIIVVAAEAIPVSTIGYPPAVLRLHPAVIATSAKFSISLLSAAVLVEQLRSMPGIGRHYQLLNRQRRKAVRPSDAG